MTVDPPTVTSLGGRVIGLGVETIKDCETTVDCSTMGDGSGCGSGFGAREGGDEESSLSESSSCVPTLGVVPVRATEYELSPPPIRINELAMSFIVRRSS